jgi:predicted DNA-binding transcriptional regulator YafY
LKEWTFLTNHALVLSLIANHPRITGREIADEVGITERAVRRLIADLDAGGYLTKSRIGKGVEYSINPDLSLRHDTHREIVIGDFLKALGWRKRKRSRPGTASQ